MTMICIYIYLVSRCKSVIIENDETEMCDAVILGS